MSAQAGQGSLQLVKWPCAGHWRWSVGQLARVLLAKAAPCRPPQEQCTSRVEWSRQASPGPGPVATSPSPGALTPVPYAIPLLENRAVLLATLEFHSMGLAQGKEAQDLSRPRGPPSCPTGAGQLVVETDQPQLCPRHGHSLTVALASSPTPGFKSLVSKMRRSGGYEGSLCRAAVVGPGLLALPSQVPLRLQMEPSGAGSPSQC